MAKNDIETRLLALQEAINEAQEKRARAEGALDECKKQLKSEFKVLDLKSAKVLLVKMEEELQGIENDLNKALAELEKKVMP